MKNWLLLFSVVYSYNVYSQDTLSLNQIRFDEIQSIRYKQSLQRNTYVYEDSAFNYFLKQQSKVSRFLIEKITDTSSTNIKWESNSGFLKSGDLAIILLSNLEMIPYYSITRMQWCICCETGYLPVGFLSYLDKDRVGFQSKYKIYFLEQEQKQSLKRNRKIRKN